MQQLLTHFLEKGIPSGEIATVMPGFPVWGMAGFIGSTIWLIWLAIIGIKFLKIEIN